MDRHLTSQELEQLLKVIRDCKWERERSRQVEEVEAVNLAQAFGMEATHSDGTTATLLALLLTTLSTTMMAGLTDLCLDNKDGIWEVACAQ